MIKGKVIPDITFMCRQGDAAPATGGCPIGGEFVPTTTSQLFKGKRVIVFSLPGAYTPTCSTYQVPGFEEQYTTLCQMGIDEVYVSSVNDAFVMNAWAQALGIKHLKVIPDGNGEFANSLGMLVDMTAVGFGRRSRRFAAVITDGVVEQDFVEPESSVDDPDPYGVSSPATVTAYLANT